MPNIGKIAAGPRRNTCICRTFGGALGRTRTFGRSPRKLKIVVNELRERGVEFVFLRESINTTPGG